MAPVTAYIPVKITAYRSFFKPPIQRQKWSDPEPHASVPWNDVFFDLFYVAGAYNLSHIIVDTPHARALMYFAGCFWAIFTMWLNEMYYQARFVVPDDNFHGLFQLSFYLVVATAILFIRPVELLSVPSEHVDMFAFSLSCVLANLFHMARYIEFIFFGIGEQAATVACRREIYSKIIPTGLYLAAAVISGVAYYQGDGDNQGRAEEEGPTNDTPIILLCCAALFDIVWGFVYLAFFLPHGERRKQ